VIEHGLAGVSGLNRGHDWLNRHAEGRIYQLGRLQFEISYMRDDIRHALLERGDVLAGQCLVLAVHIPPELGRLLAEACDDAMSMAGKFFPRHFPEHDLRYLTCHSWLLDPPLSEYLAETSNIVSFQRRFHIAAVHGPQNQSILKFVFRNPHAGVDELSPRTSLERAVVSRLREGKSWNIGAGWIEFQPNHC
jgi:hypothetical protein